MAVPPFQDFMIPLLQLTADGQEQTYAETISALADSLRLTDSDTWELLPSGRKPRLDDRVLWAAVYLRQERTSTVALPTRAHAIGTRPLPI